jgi:hypothetical protein
VRDVRQVGLGVLRFERYPFDTQTFSLTFSFGYIHTTPHRPPATIIDALLQRC